MPVTVIKVRLSNLESDFPLRSLLEASGLKPKEFAHALGVSRETISRMCCNRVKTPKQLLLAALAVCAASGCAVIYVDPAQELAATAK